MARFDVYRHPEGAGYLLDVQADVLAQLNTRVVVPLMVPRDAPLPAARLNPVFEVEGQQVVMVTQFLAAVPSMLLAQPMASLAVRDMEIINAVDMVFQGF
ncbi:CcdB family protein [Magnetovibrio blakemorei]|uniref:Toxin CcdB n=1 Tax=Magnetovibrio blakemorei TaxID=28181 RepID=A0A1E5QAQ8_9PROT|nr:CcdB family protein [Magnetovibrio blakemorei]OEJ68500.1 plasmid maintenance protein CcdB [Magnetovibrio blakemorei]